MGLADSCDITSLYDFLNNGATLPLALPEHLEEHRPSNCSSKLLVVLHHILQGLHALVAVEIPLANKLGLLFVRIANVLETPL